LRARRLVLASLAGCSAMLGGGCGVTDLAAVDTTCAQMRAQVSLFRQQATLLVDREHVQVRAGSSSQAALGVELQLRRSCRGARADYRPYRDTVAALPVGFIQPP
jgi:hypothetical protein